MLFVLDESIFEDSVTIFKEEKMPGKGSGCTSLSSITIDDDIPASVSVHIILYSLKPCGVIKLISKLFLSDEITICSSPKCTAFFKRRK